MIPPENEELNPSEPIEAKQERREMVAEATQTFLAAGGKIREMPSCQFSASRYRMQQIDFSKKSTDRVIIK